jgi:hypothetical protein
VHRASPRCSAPAFPPLFRTSFDASVAATWWACLGHLHRLVLCRLPAWMMQHTTPHAAAPDLNKGHALHYMHSPSPAARQPAHAGKSTGCARAGS